jgi:hypothetical protein
MNYKSGEDIANFFAKRFLELLFLSFPGMVFFELVTGDIAFFAIFRLILSIMCFFLGSWAHDEIIVTIQSPSKI